MFLLKIDVTTTRTMEEVEGGESADAFNFLPALSDHPNSRPPSPCFKHSSSSQMATQSHDLYAVAGMFIARYHSIIQLKPYPRLLSHPNGHRRNLCAEIHDTHFSSDLLPLNFFPLGFLLLGHSTSTLEGRRIHCRVRAYLGEVGVEAPGAFSNPNSLNFSP